jgi:hypothetical protein
METEMTEALNTAPSALPKIGAAWAGVEGSAYAGVTTDKEGAIYALVLLADKPASRLDWSAATAWATKLEASLPTRAESALLFQNLRAAFEPRWHWTSETDEDSASYAWGCGFIGGTQDYGRKSYEGCARAVRRFPLDPSILSGSAA